MYNRLFDRNGKLAMKMNAKDYILRLALQIQKFFVRFTEETACLPQKWNHPPCGQ